MSEQKRTEVPGSTTKPGRGSKHESEEKAPNLDRRDAGDRERPKSHSHIDESGAPVDAEGDRSKP